MYRDDIKAALIKSASDAEPAVRGEAICGLVSLDRPLALSLAQRELKAACVSAMIFEAAEELADDSLVEDLVHFQDRSDNSLVDGLAADALRACRGLPNERNIE
ncbi:MAG: hypothetical protein QNJ15_08015 [Erythrobacter sp.]|nr:hypothetical protein [Erythrobacter sp.]